MEKKYIISDTMQSLIDWEHIMPMERYAGGHDDQMKGLYKGAKVIGHYNENDYQGMVATCVKLPDGRFVIYNDYYGSCSGCDSWDGASDDEVRKLCIDLANGSFIFQNLKDVVEYLKAARDELKDVSGEYVASYEWQRCGKGLLDEIGQYLFGCVLSRMGFVKVESEPYPRKTIFNLEEWHLSVEIQTCGVFVVSVTGESNRECFDFDMFVEESFPDDFYFVDRLSLIFTRKIGEVLKERLTNNCRDAFHNYITRK